MFQMSAKRKSPPNKVGQQPGSEDCSSGLKPAADLEDRASTAMTEADSTSSADDQQHQPAAVNASVPEHDNNGDVMDAILRAGSSSDNESSPVSRRSSSPADDEPPFATSTPAVVQPRKKLDFGDAESVLQSNNKRKFVEGRAEDCEPDDDAEGIEDELDEGIKSDGEGLFPESNDG
jgi:hypothetical protein